MNKREVIKQKFGGRCAYCGCLLGDKWHADHVKAVFRFCGEMQKPENHNEENIFPSCIKCNLFKATFTIKDFRSEIESQVERARKYSSNFRVAERFGLIEEVKKPVVFWFETHQRINSKEPLV